MRKKQLKNILMTLSIGVWILWLATAAFQFQFSAKRLTQIRLSTTPSTVKIELNGDPIFGEGYLKTPKNLKIPPGEHTLRLTREGYVPLKINIDATIGSAFEIDPTFERRQDARFGQLAIESEMDQPLLVSVDDGLATGRIPMTVEDLLLGKVHTVVLYSENDDSPVWRCRMKFPEGVDFEEITIRQNKDGQIRVAGCKRKKRR